MLLEGAMRVSGNETEDRLTALEVNKLNAATAVGSPSMAEALEELKEQHDAEMAHLGNRIQNVIESAAEARADVAADAADARAEMHSDLEAHLASSKEEREGLRADLVALGDRVGAMQAEVRTATQPQHPTEKGSHPRPTPGGPVVCAKWDGRRGTRGDAALTPR